MRMGSVTYNNDKDIAASLTDVEHGLSSADVIARQHRGQANVVEQATSRSYADIIRSNFCTLFNLILTIGTIVVLIIGNWRDAIFGAAMVLNILMGVVSEVRAKHQLDSLAIVDAPRTVVRRDKKDKEIASSDLVLDDIFHLSLGNQVPVDATIVEVHALEVDESLLTGESVPVRKKVGDTVLAGTAVVAGSAVARATAVGEDVYAQSITRQARQFSLTKSELQQGINKVLKVVSWLIVPMIVIMVWSQLTVQGVHGDWRDALVLSVGAVLGMIPLGLVLLTSMNFALASVLLARENVLVQELPAVEVLARVDVLCLDKTGTLTTGGIHVFDFEPVAALAAGRLNQATGTGVDIHSEGSENTCDGAGDLLQPMTEHLDDAAVQALWQLNQDGTNATATAIMSALSSDSYGTTILSKDGAQDPVETWRVPFSSSRKWSGWANAKNAWVLGAPEIVVDEDAPQSRVVLDRVTQLAERGLRVIALCRTSVIPVTDELPKGLVPEILISFEEAIRDDAAQTLEYFRDQGVNIRVISGDNPMTVAAVAKEVGLVGLHGEELSVCDARTLPNDLESTEFVEAVASYDVFGRVTPEQKRAMVKAIQAKGHTVAMTGDGVNDTLALKEADLGIAMGNGASATKAVSQLVLVDGKFSVLPDAVAQGRRIIANMERVSALFLSKTVYAALIALFCAICLWNYPFLPRYWTYIDFFTIGNPAFILALVPNKRRYVPGFLSRVLRLAIPAGIILAGSAVTTYWAIGVGTPEGRTCAVLALMIGAIWLLSIVARPLVLWRLALVLLMLVGAVAGISVPALRGFFALIWPAPDNWRVVIIVGLVAGLLIEAVYQLYAAKYSRKAEEEGKASSSSRH